MTEQRNSKTLYLSSSETDEYYFKEGCHILELLNSADDPEVSIARARVVPGMETTAHQLTNVTERYLIQSGVGDVTIGDEKPKSVKANDVVVIPAGVTQKIKNTGKDDLVFLAICSPRFTVDCYVEIKD